MAKPTPTDPRPSLYAAAGNVQALQQQVLPAENSAILSAARHGHNRANKELARLGPAIQHVQTHTGDVPAHATARYLDLLLERDKYAAIMGRAADRQAQDEQLKGQS